MGKLNKSSITWTAKQIAKMAEGTLRFDNARQRGEVWDKSHRCLFVDSILRGMPVPPMYIIRTNDTITSSRGETVSVYDCIDGKQRCTTIKQFRENKFALNGLEPIIIGEDEIDLNGLTYDELPEDLRDDFDSSGFLFYYFENITDDDVTEMMNRLNNGKPMAGTVKARILSKDLHNIIKLAQHSIFSEHLTEKAILSFSNEDIVIKTYITLKDSEPSFENKRISEIYRSHVFTEDEINEINNVLDRADDVITIIRNEDKSVYRKVAKKNNMLAVISYVSSNTGDVANIAKRVKAFFTTDDKSILSQSESFNAASLNATNRASNVIIRISEIEKWCNNDYKDNGSEGNDSENNSTEENAENNAES